MRLGWKVQVDPDNDAIMAYSYTANRGPHAVRKMFSPVAIDQFAAGSEAFFDMIEKQVEEEFDLACDPD